MMKNSTDSESGSDEEEEITSDETESFTGSTDYDMSDDSNSEYKPLRKMKGGTTSNAENEIDLDDILNIDNVSISSVNLDNILNDNILESKDVSQGILDEKSSNNSKVGSDIENLI